MTKTQAVTCGARGFWAYDVGLGVFLKHLIDAAEESELAGTEWLSIAISEWRKVACISSFGLSLDACWSAEQRDEFLALAEKGCAALAMRESIPMREVMGWSFGDDLRMDTRGTSEVRTGPVVELGRAVIALVRDELPAAPSGEAWLFGAPEGRTTLQLRPEWDGKW